MAATRRAAQAVLRHALGLPELRSARRIAGYLAMPGEMDPLPLLLALRRQGRLIHLPVLDPEDGLRFAPWHANTPLRRNRFGIAEPVQPAALLRRAADLDLVFVPLVAFDRGGHRLGMGAGFYDRALAPVADRSRPRRIGLAWSFQFVDELAAAPWDVPLDAVVTERGVHRFKR